MSEEHLILIEKEIDKYLETHDILKMSFKEFEQVCKEIRDRILKEKTCQIKN